MGEEQRRGAASVRPAACGRLSAGEVGGALPTIRRHSQVPTECARCGAADFSSVVEVGVGSSRVLHWVSPPAGWYLLREARPEQGAPLLHGRCPLCMHSECERR
ncbi:MAG TPA: hypothetical protein VFS67_14925 [Polyangiaceae bacterium]|jgi:hypothetical protein|nr:hypothetical protein [Polyangiaceae bacterium]